MRDVDAHDHTVFPRFARARAALVILQPGDALFIPALWAITPPLYTIIHRATVFYRHLNASEYPARICTETPTRSSPPRR